MSNRLFASKKSKVIPFEQNGEFYHKKARKYIESNNYIEALNYYRKAVEKDPQNFEYMLDLAEVFTEMNYYEESSQILFSLLQKEKGFQSDCYFGLGCNFLGLQEYEKAEECFDKYLTLDPHGYYSEEAQNLLEVLQNQEYYSDEWDYIDPYQERLYKMASQGKDYLDRGEYKRAVRQLEKVIKLDPTLIFARNNLALAYFCTGELQRAIEITETLLKEHPQNIHANSNLALFLKEKGDFDQSKKYLNLVLGFQTDDPEEIHKIAVTLCELEEHEEANRLLRKLLQYKPYDLKVLHYTAISFFNVKKFREALEYWRKIEKICPNNTISNYYINHAEDLIKNLKKFRELPYHFQVPYDEIIRRIKKINELLKMAEADLKQKWQKDDRLHSLLTWGLELNDMVIKKAILNVVASFMDEKSEHFLRGFILRKGESEALKREALTLLKQMNAKEPYVAYVDDAIVEVKVNIMDADKVKLPGSIGDVADLVISKMKGRYEDGYEEEVKDIWMHFIAALYPNHLPRIRKQEAWAAALEYYYCCLRNIAIEKRSITEIYGVTYASLNSNYRKLQNVLGV